MTIKIQATYSPAWQRAAARAAVNAKAGRRAERIGERVYRIVSSQSGDQAYTCHVTSIVHLQAECTCPAGVSGLVCWHKAAAITAAIARCRAAAPHPEPTYGPAKQTAADIERKMDRFARTWPQGVRGSGKTAPQRFDTGAAGRQR